MFSLPYHLTYPTFFHFHDHLCSGLVVKPSHSEAEPTEGPIQILGIYVCALTRRHARLTAEVFVVEYKGHPPSGVTHIVAIVLTQDDWTAAASVKLL